MPAEDFDKLSSTFLEQRLVLFDGGGTEGTVPGPSTSSVFNEIAAGNQGRDRSVHGTSLPAYDRDFACISVIMDKDIPRTRSLRQSLRAQHW